MYNDNDNNHMTCPECRVL